MQSLSSTLEHKWRKKPLMREDEKNCEGRICWILIRTGHDFTLYRDICVCTILISAYYTAKYIGKVMIQLDATHTKFIQRPLFQHTSGINMPIVRNNTQPAAPGM
jgi:hypothetical protein